MPFTLVEAQGTEGEERGGGERGARARLCKGKVKVLVMPAVLVQL